MNVLVNSLSFLKTPGITGVLFALFAGSTFAIDAPVGAPEALRPSLEEAFKTFTYEEVPLKIQYTDSADTQFLLETDIPFNPDAGSRTLIQNQKRRVFINTKSALDQKLIWKVETAKWLGISDPLLLPKERILTDQDRRTIKTIFASKGDFNGDGRIDLLDLGILANNMDSDSGTGDLNRDGKVNQTDFDLFKELYPQ